MKILWLESEIENQKEWFWQATLNVQSKVKDIITGKNFLIKQKDEEIEEL